MVSATKVDGHIVFLKNKKEILLKV